MVPDRQLVTELLQQWGSGSKEALDELMPIVYEQLHKLASNCLRSERPDHTLRATALVHEAYLRLVDSDVTFQDRVHFYAVSARMLRRILVDHAKTKNRQKRGGEFDKIPLDDAIVIGPQADKGIIELDDAMKRLAVQDQRKSDLIELLFFGGLTYDEAAAALKISPATVHRELTLAKALYSSSGWVTLFIPFVGIGSVAGIGAGLGSRAPDEGGRCCRFFPTAAVRG